MTQESTGADAPAHAEGDFTEFADALRDAFAAVAGATLPGDERARRQRRLLAITNTAKRHPQRVQGQLARCLAEWNARGGP